MNSPDPGIRGQRGSRDAPDPPPTPPAKPDPGDCCGDGCAHCVLDLYEDALQRYQLALAEWRTRQR
jgi:hypothetical protein